jgi:hypothetical protein
VAPQVTSGRWRISRPYATARIRLSEKPVIVAIRMITSRSGDWPLASADIPRSIVAPPQPASWRFQNAWFLLAKNGVGRMGKTAMSHPP